MFCPAGHQVIDGQRFCSECGQGLFEPVLVGAPAAADVAEHTGTPAPPAFPRTPQFGPQAALGDTARPRAEDATPSQPPKIAKRIADVVVPAARRVRPGEVIASATAAVASTTAVLTGCALGIAKLADESISVADALRTAAYTIGLSFRGTGRWEGSLAFAEASGHFAVQVPVLTVTVLSLIALALGARVAERRAPSESAATAVAAGVATGAAYAIALAIVCRVARGSLSLAESFGMDAEVDGVAGLRVGVTIWPLVVWAFLLASATASAVRASAFLASRGRSVREFARNATKSWWATIAAVGTAIAASLLLSAASGVVYAGYLIVRADDMSPSDVLAAVITVVFTLGNVAMWGAGMAMGATFGASASAAGGPSGESLGNGVPADWGAGLLAGHLPGWTWGFVAITVVSMLLAGAVQAASDVKTGRRSPWWRLPVTLGGSWVFLALFSRVTGVAEASVGLDEWFSGAAEASGSAGLGYPSVALLAMAWGTAATLSGPFALRAIPRLAHRYDLDALPPLPKGARRTVAATALLLFVAAIGVAGLKVVESRLFSPDRAVETYLDAVVDGRGTAAADAVGTWPSGNDFVTKDMLVKAVSDAKAANALPKNPKIESVEVDGKIAVVEASFEADGSRATATFELAQAGKKFGLLPEWDLKAPAASVGVDGDGTLRLNGRETSAGEYDVVPWYVTVELADTELTTGGTRAGAIAPGEYGEFVISSTLRTDVRERALGAVRAKFQECAAQGSGASYGCPFRSSYLMGDTQKNFKWSFLGDPVSGATTEVGPSNTLLVSGRTTASFEYTYSYDLGYSGYYFESYTPREYTERDSDVIIWEATVLKHGDNFAVAFGS